MDIKHKLDGVLILVDGTEVRYNVDEWPLNAERHMCYWDGELVQIKTPEMIDQEELDAKWAEVRAQRDKLLQETDYTQLLDAPVTLEKQAEYATYRQQLRDITDQADVDTITWPEKPVYVKRSL
jgi:hypothetical protein